MLHHISLISLLLILLLPLLQGTTAQNPGVTVATTPFLACTFTTFGCPNSSGCCPIAGCCGSGCCPIGYSCLNEGTYSQTCCPAFDTTRCGTVSPAPAPPGNNGGSTVKNCNTMQACPMDPVRKLGWTCTLGKTCGLSYNQCYPCPYLFNVGASASASAAPPATSSYFSQLDVSTTATSFGGDNDEFVSATIGYSSSSTFVESGPSTSSSSSGGGGTKSSEGLTRKRIGTSCVLVFLGGLVFLFL